MYLFWKKIQNDKKYEYFLNSLFACICWKKLIFVVVVFMSIIIEQTHTKPNINLYITVQTQHDLVNVLHMNGNAIIVSALTLSSYAIDSRTVPTTQMRFAVVLKVK